MPTTPSLKITGASVRVAEAAGGAADAAPRAHPELEVSIDVESASDAPLHVWSTVHAYEYDAASRTLTLQLAEREPALPPGIRLLSHHPVIPQQVVVSAGGHATLRVKIPGVVRKRATTGPGLGISVVEEAIGTVDQVDVRIQHATERAAARPDESADDLRKRLLTLGDSTHTAIRITGGAGR